MDDLTLGVELEFAVINDPEPTAQYHSPYVVVESYPKGHNWTSHVHIGHGKIVQAIEDMSSGFLRVGYDATVAPKPDGFECYSQPGSLDDQLKAWKAFYESSVVNNMLVDVTGTTPGGQPKSCGLHVHLSGGDLNGVTMANMLMFINRIENVDFLVYLAGRINDYYSKINPSYTYENALTLYHDASCIGPNPGKKISPMEGGFVPTGAGVKWCCSNASQFKSLHSAGYWVRGALHVLPGFYGLGSTKTWKAGDCEFRLFQSTTSSLLFFARLEFVHAIAKYCNSIGPKDTSYTAFCIWLMDPQHTKRRVRYRHLFKWLREAGYVSGLIPRRSKATDGDPIMA